MNNASISGAGTIGGGEYGSVKVSGSGHVTDNITCAEFSASGSCRADGKIDCSGILRASGSFSCGEDLSAGEVHLSGAAKVGGDVRVGDTAKVYGALKAGESLHANGAVEIGGAVKLGGDLEADCLSLDGSVTLGGLINAERMDLCISDESRAQGLGGTNISVRAGNGGRKFLFFGSSGGKKQLTVDTVEGDMITLENVIAKTVRGIHVSIGKGCRIDRVEYSGELVVNDSPEIGERVKL